MTSECFLTPIQLSHKHIFVNALDLSNLLVDTDIPSMPLFKHNAAAVATGDIRANTPDFRTDLQLFSPGNHESSLISYLFDVSVFYYLSMKYYRQLKPRSYTAKISVFAQDDTTNETVGLRVISTRGIAVYVQSSLFFVVLIHLIPG